MKPSVEYKTFVRNPSNRVARQRAAIAIVRMMLSLQRPFTRALSGAFIRQARRVEAELVKAGDSINFARAMSIVERAIPDHDRTTEEVFERFLDTVMEEFGEMVFESLQEQQGGLLPDNPVQRFGVRVRIKSTRAAFDRAKREFIRSHGAQHVVSVNQTTKASIRRAVERGFREQQSITEIARRIERDVVGVNGITARQRALNIAQTETHTAANYAMQESMEASEVKPDKIWTHTSGEGRGRPDHIDADGQRVPFGDDFVVGGTSLHYPGDPAGGAEHTVNCMCVMMYAPVTE